MNRLLIGTKIVLGIILLFVSGAQLYAQDNMTADEIIQTMTETMNPAQSQGTFIMTIVTSSGQDRIFVYETFSKNHGEKSLMKYLKPSRVKGQAILMLNDADDIWIYFPRTKRIRKLASHAKKQKLEGSDFSYEDFGGSDAFIDDYDAVLLGEEKKEGKRCYKIELLRKEGSSVSYSKVIMWVEKETYIPLVIDYYHDDDSNLLIKELLTSDVKLIDGIYTPMKIVMYNKLDNTHTKMEVEEVTYDVDLPDDLFTEMGMQQ
ncbi:outer membrane lipoprotein-sorting protein [candidate division WOR-3 bacterium]|nr:outer membrane lipoprotein-sorting protein [candidate division WOR-3 bacterium]